LTAYGYGNCENAEKANDHSKKAAGKYAQKAGTMKKEENED
jgi:hypothetical protein